MDLAMPALPSEVDIRADLQDVCLVHKTTSSVPKRHLCFSLESGHASVRLTTEGTALIRPRQMNCS